MTLRVGMVARSINVDHLRGTGRYVQELLRNTRNEDQLRWTVYAHNPAQPMRVPPALLGETDIFSFRGDRFWLWEQMGLPMRARRAGLDLLHSGENTLPVWQPIPTIVTIHDTVLWEEPRQGLDYHYWHRVQSLAYRRTAAVITISESSRRDIAARWPFLANRLTVIPHGIADEFFETSTPDVPMALAHTLGDRPFLLYMGGPQERKRFAWALDLLARSGREDLHLVACGFASGKGQFDKVPAGVRGRVHFAPYIDDAELVALYRGAQAVLYPTLYEGFGFPAVEAQAAGTPVLFSPVSSLAELIGPLSWALPVDDFEAWRAALSEILTMPQHARAERAARGIEWARGFAWRRSAEKHMEVYQEVLARSARSSG